MTGERLNKLLDIERLNPGDAFIKFAIAQEYVNAGNDELALLYFELLSKTHPGYVPLYYHWGRLQERKGALQQACEIYRAGIEVARNAHDIKTAVELQEALTLLDDE